MKSRTKHLVQCGQLLEVDIEELDRESDSELDDEDLDSDSELDDDEDDDELEEGFSQHIHGLPIFTLHYFKRINF